MITPSELFEKSNKLFNRVITAVLLEKDIFPLILPSNKNLSGTSFTELQTSLVPLYQHSKQAKGKGYTIEWKEKTVDGTKQKLPSKIFFETLNDYLYYTGRAKDYEAVNNSFEKLISSFPFLSDWAKENVVFLLTQAEIMDDLIKVCAYFYNNKPLHNLYLRELPIEVHSKFIENNSAALKRILDVILPVDWINKNETDFSSRYYIKKPTIYAQIRILDDNLRPAIGYDELALTLDDSASLTWQPEKVFIIENRACFLSFPKVKNAVALFGEGFKSRISKHIPWIKNADLYCWFDLDAAGFEMLNIIRQYYPSATSLMMDKSTYIHFKQFAVISAYRKILLDQLTTNELELYEFLQKNNIRLEQERITNNYIQNQLDSIIAGQSRLL